jgi:hypothetical protein
MSLLSLLGIIIFIVFCYGVKLAIKSYEPKKQDVIKYVDENDQIKIINIPYAPRNWNGTISVFILGGIMILWILFGVYLMLHIGPGLYFDKFKLWW